MASYRVSDRETISSVSGSTGFTSSKLVDYLVYAFVQAIDGNVRFTIEGTTPTSSKGVRLIKDSSVEIWGGQAMTAFRCIDDGGTAKLEVIYMTRA